MASRSRSLPAIVEEVQLLKHSLLPDERMILLSPPTAEEQWENALDSMAVEGPGELSESLNGDRLLNLSFELEDWRSLWFEASIRVSSEDEVINHQEWYDISVKGEQLGRDDQARWQGVVRERRREVQDSGSEYPLYQLVSEHLLPLLHEECLARSTSHETTGAQSDAPRSPGPVFHALLTSHHLKSPNKRRSMAHWAAQLHLTGFAKVGHPGVMYAEGGREDVEEFVQNVEAMQWLALRVRFVEELPEGLRPATKKQWKEFEKVGEVVDEMRRLGGREAFVVEMGIGSAK